MDLDRGVLAKVDRQLLAGLRHDQTSRMVRVPVSDAMWATWKRYCAAREGFFPRKSEFKPTSVLNSPGAVR